MNGVPILVEYKGQTLNLKQLAKACGVGTATILRRYNSGDRGERLTRPPDERFKHRGRW